MTIMLDIIGAAIIMGMLLITIMNVNINLSSENYKGIQELHTQTEAIQLARIIEFDFYKIGYTIPAASRPAITIAEETHLKFKTNLRDLPGWVDIVEYGLGGAVANTTNPRDKMLFRIENTTKVYINYSITNFKLFYYNGRDSLLTAPITGAWLDSIKAIKVAMRLESPEPFDTTRSGGYPYASAIYQKLIYPRNL